MNGSPGATPPTSIYPSLTWVQVHLDLHGYQDLPVQNTGRVAVLNLYNYKYLNSFSEATVFIRQNLTSTDVKF